MILLDGGKGQLNIAVAVLEELGVTDVDVSSIAKSRVLDEQGHVARGKAKPRPVSEDIDRSPERIFRPGRKNPVIFRENSNELFLLQQLRDEAHRRAITHHKKLRQKRTLTSPLLAIEGIGPKKARELLRHFGSLKAIKSATLAELAAAPGVSETLAERISEALSTS